MGDISPVVKILSSSEGECKVRSDRIPTSGVGDEQPLAIITNIGDYGLGKSFLSNILLNYLKQVTLDVGWYGSLPSNLCLKCWNTNLTVKTSNIFNNEEPSLLNNCALFLGRFQFWTLPAHKSGFSDWKLYSVGNKWNWHDFQLRHLRQWQSMLLNLWRCIFFHSLASQNHGGIVRLYGEVSKSPTVSVLSMLISDFTSGENQWRNRRGCRSEPSALSS